MTSELQRDIDWVDDHMEHASDATKERWKRLCARLEQAPPAAVPEGMVMVQRADLAALEAADFGRCGWSARADLAARRLRDGLLAAANKENNNG